MEDTLALKINGPEVLERQLAFRQKKDQYGIIALASATDPYIRHEEKYRITRQYLEAIRRFRFPVLMITKSDLILRDLDLLHEIDQHAIHAHDLKEKATRGVVVSFSFSTLDPDISQALEPGAPLPQQRLETMKKVSESGLLVGMNCIPTLPFISDSGDQLKALVTAGKEYGASYALIGGLTLFGSKPADSKVLYYKFLDRKFPHLIKDYKSLYRIFFSPPPGYIKDLDARAESVCREVGIRRTIWI